MNEEFNLESYLSDGVENIIKGAIKATLMNPKESIFMAKYALASKKASSIRQHAEQRGEHIPPFLIASITSKCNLHCKGCYSRTNNSCHDDLAINQLTDEEWIRVFDEARNLGIGFIILAGGEPMMRPDIIKAAAQIQDVLFPIFTNGTLFNEDYLNLISKCCNLIPVLSIEGNEDITDKRRGVGVYNKLINTMDDLQKNKILYGASITVIKENINNVTSEEFLDKLFARGCKVVFFVEYVPVENSTKDLAPQEVEREFLNIKVSELRKKYEEMIFISFPGDEKSSGGCLAAGRGFFHINSNGGAEPCPFSPYSDTNLRHVSLKEALNSPLFKKLQDSSVLIEEHDGGCVLFENKETVQDLLQA